MQYIENDKLKVGVKETGVELDEEKNETCRGGVISKDSSRVIVSVIPANEELGVARETYGLSI